MKTNMISEELQRQTKLVWEYLEMAKPLISYTNLIPVNEQQILEYEKGYDKIIPPDYRHWLNTYGSGRIEFQTIGELTIPSIHELANDDGRLIDDDDPANCWKRIYIGFAGAPGAVAHDSTIIDKHGCAPIIWTKSRSNKVDKVRASSWPMFLILSLIEAANRLGDDEMARLSEEQKHAVVTLTKTPFKNLDSGLDDATERAEAQNKTDISESDNPDAVSGSMALDSMQSMMSFLGEIEESKRQRSIFGRLKRKISGLFISDDQFAKNVAELENLISEGYSDLSYTKPARFLSEKVELQHEKGLKKLLHHDRCEVREIAKKGLGRLNPAESEKIANDTIQ